MGIQRDQLFLNLYNLNFIDFIKKKLHFIPERMRTINSTFVKLYLLREICYDNPYNLILFPFDDRLRLTIQQIWNCNIHILPESITF